MSGLLGVLVVWCLVVALPLALLRVWWELLCYAVVAAGRALGPRERGAHDPRLRPMRADGEPALLAYWYARLVPDAVDALRAAYRVVWQGLQYWLRGRAGHLLRGRRPRTGLKGGPWAKVFFSAVAPGVALASLLGTALAWATLLPVFVLFAVFLVPCLLVPWCCAAFLRAGRASERWLRRVRPACPYPDCYRDIKVLARACPGCGDLHRAPLPGRYGVLRHVCRCGDRLAVVPSAARRALLCHCPHCERPLPEVLARTRVVHLPLVGAASSGKTMYLAALLRGLDSWGERGGFRVTSATREDQATARTLADDVRGSGWALKTQGEPRALMLLVSRGRRQRLLFLYDPMGEALRDPDTLRRQEYLAHADGVLLLVDVLADPSVRKRLSAADRLAAERGRPAVRGPLDTYYVLTGELGALTGRRERLAVASLVPKRDLLDGLDSLPVLGPEVDAWLTDVGLGVLVSGLAHDFGAARHWAVSAHKAVQETDGKGEARRAAEPVLWLLRRSGLRLPGVPVPGNGRGSGVRLPRQRGSGAAGTGASAPGAPDEEAREARAR
ncbi:TRAFAC clade GTPase domain-containing protein [Streptomyces sp. P6-2-1]|uniref:TRAFAC clade GTPase domain-containing protein n=1 Tax=Streptomyces sp. P6-2-1 TaxID=3422591 RepID=UPI003D366233